MILFYFDNLINYKEITKRNDKIIKQGLESLWSSRKYYADIGSLNKLPSINNK
jgi:hypothetical protein